MFCLGQYVLSGAWLFCLEKVSRPLESAESSGACVGAGSVARVGKGWGFIKTYPLFFGQDGVEGLELCLDGLGLVWAFR